MHSNCVRHRRLRDPVYIVTVEVDDQVVHQRRHGVGWCGDEGGVERRGAADPAQRGPECTDHLLGQPGVRPLHQSGVPAVQQLDRYQCGPVDDGVGDHGEVVCDPVRGLTDGRIDLCCGDLDHGGAHALDVGRGDAFGAKE